MLTCLHVYQAPILLHITKIYSKYQYYLQACGFIQSYSTSLTFRQLAIVLLMLLFIFLLPTVSHYSMKLQSVYTLPRAPSACWCRIHLYGIEDNAVN